MEYSSLSKTVLGITLTLAPSSHKAFSNIWLPIEQSIVGYPGSIFLMGEDRRIASLHAYVSLMTSVVGNGPLLSMARSTLRM